MKWVSVSEKRSFLKWFLEHHRLKQPDARKVLEYLIKNVNILEHVSFSETIDLNKKTIVISSVTSDEIGFTFYHKKHKTEDVSQALGELMASPFDKVNLILHFYGKMSNFRYTELLIKPPTNNVKQYEQFQEYSKEADAIIKQVLLTKEIENTRVQIDDALDTKEKQRFQRLVERLKELEHELAQVHVSS